MQPSVTHEPHGYTHMELFKPDASSLKKVDLVLKEKNTYRGFLRNLFCFVFVVVVGVSSPFTPAGPRYPHPSQSGSWLPSVQLTEVCRGSAGQLAHFIPLQQACALSTGEIGFAPSKCKISSHCWHCNTSVKAWDLPSRTGCFTNFTNSPRIQTNHFKACTQFANHTRTVKLLKRPNEHLI